MSSIEFAKICRELHSLNETVTITTFQNAIEFSVDGEVGDGKIRLGAGEEFQTSFAVEHGVS
jgi:hypothetical protein